MPAAVRRARDELMQPRKDARGGANRKPRDASFTSFRGTHPGIQRALDADTLLRTVDRSLAGARTASPQTEKPSNSLDSLLDIINTEHALMQGSNEASPTPTGNAALPPTYGTVSPNDASAPLAPPRKEPEQDLATGSSNTALDLAEQLAEQLFPGAFAEAPSIADVQSVSRVPVRKMPVGIGKPSHNAAIRWASNAHAAHAAFAWQHGMVLQPLPPMHMPMHPWQGW